MGSDRIQTKRSYSLLVFFKYKLKHMKKYHYLIKNEIILDGDEVDISNYSDDNYSWSKTNLIGSKAPDPKFPGHRLYRREYDGEYVKRQTNWGRIVYVRLVNNVWEERTLINNVQSIQIFKESDFQ